jgi:hypothetical protein
LHHLAVLHVIRRLPPLGECQRAEDGESEGHDTDATELPRIHGSTLSFEDVIRTEARAIAISTPTERTS